LCGQALNQRTRLGFTRQQLLEVAQSNLRQLSLSLSVAALVALCLATSAVIVGDLFATESRQKKHAKSKSPGDATPAGFELDSPLRNPTMSPASDRVLSQGRMRPAASTQRTMMDAGVLVGTREDGPDVLSDFDDGWQDSDAAPVSRRRRSMSASATADADAAAAGGHEGPTAGNAETVLPQHDANDGTSPAAESPTGAAGAVPVTPVRYLI
jgi:hypothetical protein